MKFM